MGGGADAQDKRRGDWRVECRILSRIWGRAIQKVLSVMTQVLVASADFARALVSIDL